MRIFLVIVSLFATVFCFAEEPIPFDNLQMWLKADSVDSNSDFFLPSMRNMSNKRFAANQTDLKYRPLYIRDFVQHRPAVTMSDSRGFAFGTLPFKLDSVVYLGYYHEVADKPMEFRIETFNYDDVYKENAKNGFVLGIYDNMFAFHGQPGYSSAFAEFIMYEHKPDEKVDRQIRRYLMGRYGLCFDKRLVRNSAAILVGNAVSLSNVLTLENKTMVCAAGIKQKLKRREQTTLDLVRSYNHGDKWSQTIGQILDADEYENAQKPLLYLSSNNLLYCFYSEKQPDGSWKQAFKYSADDGYNWSKTSYIESLSGKDQVWISSFVSLMGKMYFCVCSADKPAVLLVSDTIDKEAKPENVLWKVESKLSDTVSKIDKAVFSSASICVYQKRLCCILNSDDGFIYQCFSADGGRLWSDAKKCQTVGGDELRNPKVFSPYPFEADGKLMMCFRNCTQRDFEQRDTIWISEAVVDNDLMKWSQPRVFVYSKEYDSDAAMTISYGGVSVDGKITAAVICGESAYFPKVELNDTILPVGVGVFELSDGPVEQEFYVIPEPVSLLDGRMVINVEISPDALDEDTLLLRIGEDNNKIVLFAEKGRFGLYLTDGDKPAVYKSCRYTDHKPHDLLIDIDGTADIMRIIVDGDSACMDDDEGRAWVYFSPQIEQVTNPEAKLFIPSSSHGFIKKLSMYYPQIEH